MPQVWLDGEFTDEDAATLDARDGGFLHAAGVFTTLRAADGRVFRIDHHLRRLRESCAALAVPLKPTDATIAEAADGLLKRNGLPDARLRLTATRGRTAIDPLHGEVHRPTLLLTAGPMTPYPPEFYDRGMTVLLNSEQKLNPYDVQAGHKTLDYLSRLAALREAARRGAGESLWFDVHNRLMSGSVCNVFVVEEGRVVTPPTTAEAGERTPVLPGVVRGWVIGEVGDVAREAINVDRLLAAGEVFLTNSVMGVMPVSRLEGSVVGDGTPGPVARRLRAAFEASL